MLVAAGLPHVIVGLGPAKVFVIESWMPFAVPSRAETPADVREKEFRPSNSARKVVLALWHLTDAYRTEIVSSDNGRENAVVGVASTVVSSIRTGQRP